MTPEKLNALGLPDGTMAIFVKPTKKGEFDIDVFFQNMTSKEEKLARVMTACEVLFKVGESLASKS